MNNLLLPILFLSFIILIICIFTKAKNNKEEYRPLDVGKGPYGNPLINPTKWKKDRRRRRLRNPYFYNFYNYPRQPTWIPGGYYGCPLRDGCWV
jgi:hypothetical protein